MPGKGLVWTMESGRSSTLKLRNGETDASVMIVRGGGAGRPRDPDAPPQRRPRRAVGASDIPVTFLACGSARRSARRGRQRLGAAPCAA
jgi:hypothetical protein